MEPAPVDDRLLAQIKKTVGHALDSLEIKSGASHAEIKVKDDGTINIIEIGARMGGDCIGSELVRYSTGYDFVKMVIQVACGNQPDFKKVCAPTAVESKYIFNDLDLEEFNDIMKYEPERILQVSDFHLENIGHITDSSNRAGCYIRKFKC